MKGMKHRMKIMWTAGIQKELYEDMILHTITVLYKYVGISSRLTACYHGMVFVYFFWRLCVIPVADCATKEGEINARTKTTTSVGNKHPSTHQLLLFLRTYSINLWCNKLSSSHTYDGQVAGHAILQDVAMLHVLHAFYYVLPSATRFLGSLCTQSPGPNLSLLSRTYHRIHTELTKHSKRLKMG